MNISTINLKTGKEKSIFYKCKTNSKLGNPTFLHFVFYRLNILQLTKWK